MNHKVLDIAGLSIALIGAVILAAGLIVTRKRALKIGVSRIAEEEEHQNLLLPHVKDEIRESRFAFIGLVFLIVGFILQILARTL